MGATAGRIHRGRKFDQVVEGAREVFLQQGFDGANVDDIACSAGVSKATLYNYFPDKRLLFVEVATRECRRQAENVPSVIDSARPPSEVLTETAERMMCLFLSNIWHAMFRIAVVEAERFPELARSFWNNGPTRWHETLVAYLRAATERGELAIEDYDLAADQFTELCKADLYPRMQMGLEHSFTRAERRRVARGAVEMFLTRYGT
ncbi:TetR/AcrR family transcriptional regulator [Tropicimonas sp.]|uniref:TetR/AcrR family transcriptional regulator n=1 Tax=Tropicimonas sp. TaxID=2067044 RepID=UPI003A84D45B